VDATIKKMAPFLYGSGRGGKSRVSSANIFL
jgi:hypothetical protein